jgi:hypothetical protein
MDSDGIHLIERFLDDSIERPELETLLGRLDRDPEFRLEFSSALRMRGLLDGALSSDPGSERLAQVVEVAIRVGDGRLGERVMDEIGKREPSLLPRGRFAWLSRPRARIAAGIAAAWLIAIGVLITLHEPRAIQVSAAGPGVRIDRGSESLSAHAGLPLEGGDRMVVPPRSWASLRYADGTSVELAPETAIELEGGPLHPGTKKILLEKGRLTADVRPQPADRPMVVRSPDAEARVVGTDLAVTVGGGQTRLHVRHGMVSFSRRESAEAIEVLGGQAATVAPGVDLRAEPAGAEVLQKLGKHHVMLGVMSSLAEPWMEEVRQQGCRFDLRYQHLSWNWTKWNANGGFIPMYIQESEKLGVIPVFSYYSMILASPGKDTGMGPAAVAVNCVHADTMKRYWSDVLLFMKKAGESGKPVILHVEPDVWGYFLSAPEFQPNNPASIRVAVQSTGLSDLSALDNTLSSFGKAFGILRDRYAPNVILAWHASRRPEVSARQEAAALQACGPWDLVFTDVGDRDAGFREARTGDKSGWWEEKDFTAFREWSAELHRETGLPLLLWRIPLGNRVMAACNNTPWHYMDNRAEYWLENYPQNPHLAEWARAGFVGFLFGGGTVECTVQKDNAKDGVTNPPPIPGNQGETSTFSDDDGGYLRLRCGRYYQSGPLPLP